MSKIKRFAMRLWAIPYVRHPLLALLALVGLLTVMFLFLNIFTRHGAEYEVPDFRGIILEDASKLAEPLSLRLTVADSTFNPLFCPHAVMEQYPRVGSKVKQNRRIFLTINSIHPEMVAFPRGAWEPYRTAFAAVRESKLQVGRIHFVRATTVRSLREESHDSLWSSDRTTDFIGHTEVQSWTFRGRTLQPGDSLYAGSIVDVVLGLDASRQDAAEVPNVKGLTLEQARASLARALLNVGRVSYDAKTVRTLADSLSATVVRQGFPESYDALKGLTPSRVAFGTPVDLHLTAAKRGGAH